MCVFKFVNVYTYRPNQQIGDFHQSFSITLHNLDRVFSHSPPPRIRFRLKNRLCCSHPLFCVCFIFLLSWQNIQLWSNNLRSIDLRRDQDADSLESHHLWGFGKCAVKEASTLVRLAGIWAHTGLFSRVVQEYLLTFLRKWKSLCFTWSL